MPVPGNDMNSDLWAVCPGVEGDESRSPRYFKEKEAATRFLNTMVRMPDFAFEAQRRGVTVEEIKAQVRDGTLNPDFFLLSESSVTNRDQGWKDPVPIRRAADYSGPKCDRMVRNFLTVSRIGPMPTSNVEEEIGRALEGRSGDFTCCLGEDWRFKEIEADAWRRPEHEYAGNRHDSIAEIVVHAVHDVETAFLRLHPKASCAAIVDFWRSWQVQRHIAYFCGKLAESSTARMIAADTSEQVERARIYTYRQLDVFAHEVLDGGASPARQGYRAEIRAYMKKKGFKTNQQAAHHFAISVDTLKSIMSTQGKKKYSDETLNEVLRKIRSAER